MPASSSTSLGQGTLSPCRSINARTMRPWPLSSSNIELGENAAITILDGNWTSSHRYYCLTDMYRVGQNRLFLEVCNSHICSHTLCFKKKPDPRNFLLELCENCFNINKNWYTQPAYDVIKLQYYNCTHNTSTTILKCASHYVLISLSSKILSQCKQ